MTNMINITKMIRTKMIKKLILPCVFSLFLLASCQTASNEIEYDTRAIERLDGLSETIGKLNSCSYTLNTIVSDNSKSGFNAQHDVYFRGPDKMYVHTEGTKGKKSYWYNGKRLAWLSYDKNVFDTISAPDNILEAIDFLHNKYGIDFPAADFFYPTLTDDIIANYDKVLFAAEQKIGGIACTVIEATNETHTMQIWIEKETNLPCKLVIESKNTEFDYYEAIFSNWRINPRLPDSMFEFEPPISATRNKLQPKI